MKVLNEYKTHHYFETYEFNPNLYCVNCGARGVWVSIVGDYYVGGEHACIVCRHFFYCPHGPWIAKDDKETKIIEQLISGKTLEPTTPRGK
jgi:hypothetical protein